MLTVLSILPELCLRARQAQQERKPLSRFQPGLQAHCATIALHTVTLWETLCKSLRRLTLSPAHARPAMRATPARECASGALRTTTVQEAICQHNLAQPPRSLRRAAPSGRTASVRRVTREMTAGRARRAPRARGRPPTGALLAPHARRTLSARQRARTPTPVSVSPDSRERTAGRARRARPGSTSPTREQRPASRARRTRARASRDAQTLRSVCVQLASET